MTPVAKALWFIESHSDEPITLDDVASAAGVSRYHLVRAFTTLTGKPVMRYVRARRLSRAAAQLADGASDILMVALEAGYQSHEAFTRAFRDLFGTTPEEVRGGATTADLNLVEALRMDDFPKTPLTGPRMTNLGPITLAGLLERYHCSELADIPAQWQRFAPHIGAIDGQRGDTTFGVVFDADESGNISYLTAVEVADGSDVPRDLHRLQLPARRYAVFDHAGHVSTIRSTWRAALEDWLPTSGHAIAAAPELERYGGNFDPRTGLGGVEIWLPLENGSAAAARP